MARAKVIHSTHAVTVLFAGNPADPEPQTGVIKFPGGHVEVTRTTDGKYWAHTYIDNAAVIYNSRIDYKPGGMRSDIPQIEYDQDISKLAILIGKGT